MEEKTPEERIKLEDRILAGAEARRILGSEIWALAIDASELTLIRKIVQSDPEEKQLREDCYFELRALASIRKRLTNLEERGRVADSTLNPPEQE
jgi:hypothetical protein